MYRLLAASLVVALTYPGNNAAFLEQLLSSDRLVAQTTPYSESPIVAYPRGRRQVRSRPLVS